MAKKPKKVKAIQEEDAPAKRAHAKLVKVEHVFNTQRTIPGYTYATSEEPEKIYRYTYQIL